MRTEEEIRQHLSIYTAKLKPNPNNFIIVDKWNCRAIKTYKYEIFDYISECIDEMIIEACHKAVFPSINEINIGVIDVDKDEHMWYNNFNKWNWTKFENGVIKIEKMTREEFNDAVMNILLNESFSSLAMLFDAEDISRYKIAQYDEDDWDVEASMPLDDFLDELYEVMRGDDNSKRVNGFI